MIRVASVECTELLASPLKESALFLTSPGSPIRPLLEESGCTVQSLPWIMQANLLSRDEEIFLHPQTTELLRKEKIGAIWLSDWSSPALEAWAKKNGFLLLCPPYRDQKRFEDKVSFDAVLRTYALPVPEGRAVRTQEEVKNANLFPAILQQTKSHGAVGTFFLPAPTSADAFDDVFDGTPLLLRRYVEGLPVGITLLIGQAQAIVSAPRLQLHWITAADRRPYLGIQWVPRSALPAQAVASLEESLPRIIDTLRAEGFRGSANLDCVLTETDVFIIECNPRQSAASLQLIAHPALLHGCDFAAELLRLSAEGTLSVNALTLPEASYTGTTFDLDVLQIPDSSPIPRSGCYDFTDSGLSYRGTSCKKNNEHAILLHALPIEPDAESRGYLYADFPVADIHGLAFALSESGRNLVSSLEHLFTTTL